ncbi:hypothetical protein WJT86_08810 [Microvirga sp. W0021]|uniref:SGNH hydrolase-type esterase domain-containing protein n=1 Tax=Hohaiivirga grylli TaxID=3133970 RepID=A0ABV0BKC6_9HYPH
MQIFSLRQIVLILGIVLVFNTASAQPRDSQQDASTPSRGFSNIFERQPPKAEGFSLRRLFGIEDEPQPSRPSTAPVSRPKPKAPVVRKQREKPQAQNRIMVFGDWLADNLSQGLDETFADIPTIAIDRRTYPNQGLSSDNRGGWLKLVSDYLAGKPKVTIAVLMMGVSDLVPIVENGEKHPALTDPWKRLYSERVSAILREFANKGVPVVWVGLPPVSDNLASEQYAAINALVQDRVKASGGSFIDIWAGFVDDDGKFTFDGPDANGEPTKLRLTDGIYFTRKGANKIAYYVSAEIKRLLGGNLTNRDVPTVLPDNSQNNGPFLEIDKTIIPESTLTNQEIGPVLPLTRTDVSPNGILLKGRTDLNAASVARKAYRTGEPAAATPGRIDNYTLPAN